MEWRKEAMMTDAFIPVHHVETGQFDTTPLVSLLWRLYTSQEKGSFTLPL
jgi:hypothetical protein